MRAEAIRGLAQPAATECGDSSAPQFSVTGAGSDVNGDYYCHCAGCGPHGSPEYYRNDRARRVYFSECAAMGSSVSNENLGEGSCAWWFWDVANTGRAYYYKPTGPWTADLPVKRPTICHESCRN